MKNKKMAFKLKTYYTSATILKISGIALALTSLVLLMYKAIRSNLELNATREEITSILPLIDSLEYNKKLQKRGVVFVDEYINLTNENNYKEIMHLYADNVNKFYTKENMNRSDIEIEMEKHQKRVPFDSIAYKSNEILVSPLSNNKLKVIVPALYSKNPSVTPFEPIYIVIILNVQDKIISISNYKDFNNIGS